MMITKEQALESLDILKGYAPVHVRNKATTIKYYIGQSQPVSEGKAMDEFVVEFHPDMEEKVLQDMLDEYQRLKAENEVLREALEAIAYPIKYTEERPPLPGDPQYLKEIARQALATYGKEEK